MKGIRAALVILGILIGVYSSGQENYVPGKIITLEGDTINVLIDYRNWGKNPYDISWKTNLEDEIHKFTPLNILGFIVQDEMYISAIVERETSPVTLGDLKLDPELKMDVDTTFLQTIVQGSKSLYYYKDGDGKDQFYIGKDSTFDLLIYKKYYTLYKGTEYPAENKKYLGQLSLYMNDCPSIQPKLQKTKYSSQSLENLFLFYYDCVNSSSEFHKKTERLSVEIGALAGISLTSLTFHGTNTHYLVTTDFPVSANFTGGFYFDVILPRNQKKWSICNELIFTSYDVEGSYLYVRDAAEYRLTENEIGYGYLKMNNMLRYKYPIHNVHLYMNAGLSTGIALYEINERRMETHIYSTVKIEEGKAIDDTRRIEMGINIGVGAKYKRYSFEMRYEKGNGSMVYTDMHSSTGRFYFLFGFMF